MKDWQFAIVFTLLGFLVWQSYLTRIDAEHASQRLGPQVEEVGQHG